MSDTIKIRKKPHIAVRILTTLLCLAISLFLVASALLIPAVDCLGAVLDPDNMSDIIDDMDFKAILNEVKSNSTFNSDVKQAAEFLTEVVTTDQGRELLELYIGQIAAEVRGEETTATLNSDAIYNYLKTNFDDLKESMLGKDFAAELDNALAKGLITQTEYDDLIEDALKSMSDAFAELIPDLSDITESLGIAAGVVVALVSRTFMIIIVGFVVVFSALIFVCKLYKRNGLIWLAVDYGLISACIFFFAGIFVSAGKTAAIISEDLFSIFAPITAPILIFIGKRLVLTAFIFLALTVIAILWRCIYGARYKKALKAQDTSGVAEGPEAKDSDYLYAEPEAVPVEPVPEYTYAEIEAKPEEAPVEPVETEPKETVAEPEEAPVEEKTDDQK